MTHAHSSTPQNVPHLTPHAGPSPISHGRRQTLGGVAGLLTGLSLTGSAQTGETARREPATQGWAPSAAQGRVDVHAHYLPEQYRSALQAAGHGRPSGMPAIPRWSVDEHVAMMDDIHIDAAMLSISAPGLHFGDDAAARQLAHYCNEQGARAMQRHPKRFGLFAALPLPDVDGALAEVEYAFDTLHADGVIMESNYHGVYLGDARLDPVFAELNRRKTKVFIHPTDPYCPCCQGAKPQGQTQAGQQPDQAMSAQADGPTLPQALPPLGYPYPMMEFIFETTRAVFNLILTGTLEKYPDIKVIVPHAGAAIPALAARVGVISTLLKLGRNERRMEDAIRALYYDLAGMPEPIALAALLQIADPAHVLYGSDYPYTPAPLAARLAQVLDTSANIPPTLQRAFMRDNALALFPRLLQ